MCCCWFVLQDIYGQVACLSVEGSHEIGNSNILDTIICGSIDIMNGRGELWGGDVKAG